MSEKKCSGCDKTITSYNDNYPHLTSWALSECPDCGSKKRYFAPSPPVYECLGCGWHTPDPTEVCSDENGGCGTISNLRLVKSYHFVQCPKCKGDNYPGAKSCAWCNFKINTFCVPNSSLKCQFVKHYDILSKIFKSFLVLVIVLWLFGII